MVPDVWNTSRNPVNEMRNNEWGTFQINDDAILTLSSQKELDPRIADLSFQDDVPCYTLEKY